MNSLVDWEGVSCDPRPLLVVPVFRGGRRFERCLASLQGAEPYFAAVLLSINSTPDSPDLAVAQEFQKSFGSVVVVLNTGQEMNSMSHSRFWSRNLYELGVPSSKPLMWLGHDDELEIAGLEVSAPGGQWPDTSDTIFLGPWKMRHESASEIYEIPVNEKLETWTCFPKQIKKPEPSMDWVCDQLRQPTYLNLSGGLFPLAGMTDIDQSRVRKISGMRMEMTLATAFGIRKTSEFLEPVTIVYGRSDSDRASIPRSEAITDDRRLLLWLARYAVRTPGARIPFIMTMGHLFALRVKVLLGIGKLPQEEWVVRP